MGATAGGEGLCRQPASGLPEIWGLQRRGPRREAEHHGELDRPAVEVPLTPGTPARPLSLQDAVCAVSTLPQQAPGVPGQPPQDGAQMPGTRPETPPGRARAGLRLRNPGPPHTGWRHSPSFQRPLRGTGAQPPGPSALLRHDADPAGPGHTRRAPAEDTVLGRTQLRFNLEQCEQNILLINLSLLSPPCPTFFLSFLFLFNMGTL